LDFRNRKDICRDTLVIDKGCRAFPTAVLRCLSDQKAPWESEMSSTPPESQRLLITRRFESIIVTRLWNSVEQNSFWGTIYQFMSLPMVDMFFNWLVSLYELNDARYAGLLRGTIVAAYIARKRHAKTYSQKPVRRNISSNNLGV
jgi:hypothetical protein